MTMLNNEETDPECRAAICVSVCIAALLSTICGILDLTLCALDAPFLAKQLFDASFAVCALCNLVSIFAMIYSLSETNKQRFWTYVISSIVFSVGQSCLWTLHYSIFDHIIGDEHKTIDASVGYCSMAGFMAFMWNIFFVICMIFAIIYKLWVFFVMCDKQSINIASEEETTKNSSDYIRSHREV